jgi:hypothetical protein
MAKSTYSAAIATKICEMLVEGKSLRQICEEPGMPNKATVLRWLADEKKSDFRDQYARAREMQAEAMAEEIIEIADDGRNDWMEVLSKDGENVGWRVNGEAVQRSRLRVDARKWLMSKLLPKKYGETKDDGEGQGEVKIHGGLPD